MNPGKVQERAASRRRRKVVIIGGVGRMEGRYRALVEATGRELVFVERGNTGAVEGVDAVLLVVPVCGHNQQEAAGLLTARTGARLMPLRTASQSAVKAALAQLGAA